MADRVFRACMQIEKFFGRFSLRAGCMAVAALYTMLSFLALLTVYLISGSNVLPKDKLFGCEVNYTLKTPAYQNSSREDGVANEVYKAYRVGKRLLLLYLIKLFCNILDPVLQICTTFVSIVVITFCSLFVLGIRKIRPELMHPCVLLDVIVGFILSFALPFAIVKFYKYDSKVKAACTTVIGLLYLTLHAYLWLVIFKFYREIKAEAEIAEERNEPEIRPTRAKTSNA